MKIKERNTKIDIFRGMAILLVVLGHAISTSGLAGYETSDVMDIIWTLQMPMFFLISGYVTRYSKPIVKLDDLKSFIVRKTCSYLIPWFVWTLIIRALIFGRHDFFNIKHLLWHMDDGYWFLVSLYVINIVYGVGSFLSNKIKTDNRIRKAFFTCLFSMAPIAVILVISFVAGISFLANKLTMYYLAFYYIGYLFSSIENICNDNKKYDKAKIICIAFASLAYVILVKNYDLYLLGDSVKEICIRFMSSLLGCICIFGLISPLLDNQMLSARKWIGTHSLQIYLCQYLTLRILILPEELSLPSFTGFILITIRYIVIIVLTVVIIALAEQNRLLNKILFWK